LPSLLLHGSLQWMHPCTQNAHVSCMFQAARRHTLIAHEQHAAHLRMRLRKEGRGRLGRLRHEGEERQKKNANCAERFLCPLLFCCSCSICCTMPSYALLCRIQRVLYGVPMSPCFLMRFVTSFADSGKSNTLKKSRQLSSQDPVGKTSHQCESAQCGLAAQKGNATTIRSTCQCTFTLASVLVSLYL
jgi:hypothetical protein